MSNQIEKKYKSIKNLANIKKYIINNIVIVLITIILLNVLMLNANKSMATASKTYTQTIKSGIDAFPESYREYLNELKDKHPNWNFEAYYTGISWDELVENETDHGHNRIIKSADSLWLCSCKNVASGYACASESIIKYYMDPRNFIKNDVLVFQFLEMTYNPNVQNKAGVESILKNTFMNTTVEIKDRGTMSYADIIMEAAKQSNMSPYSIATKIIQEVGSSGSESVSGTYAGFEDYYNFFNYGANDEGSAVSNGLAYAVSKGWNNQYIAIVEGAKLLANDYTNAGQNTAYFYKWDVVGDTILTAGNTITISSDCLFRHQYMTNIQDPTSQTSRLYNTYLSNDILDASLNFIIPVYNDMPNLNKLPTSLTEADGELYYSVGTGVNVRSGPGTGYSAIGIINTLDEVVAMQERETSVDSNGTKWDKVKLSNGVVGYVASQYLKSCSTSDTNIEIKQEEETAIATATVQLTDGSLRIRGTPSSSGVRVGSIEKGEVLEILQKDVAYNDNYTWYKIRYNGITGYVASQYLTNIVDINNSSGTNVDNSSQNLENSTIKIEENIISIPNVTVKTMTTELKFTNYQVTKNGTVIEESQNIGTGYIVKNLDTNEEKTIIVKGDVNGDGKVNSSDALAVLQQSVNIINKEGIYLEAMDVNKDEKINSADALLILQNSVGIEDILI